jgi:hypothetical protein
MVAGFMDSIYKGYPYGSLLFWRTRESLKTERRLGPFRLPPRDPHYPIDYVLDGQQRVTSLFGVFQTELPEEVDNEWMKIYFDYRADPNIQESQFFPLADDEVDPDRHLPLKCLFDTVAYRSATRHLEDDIATRIDEMQSEFKEAQVPIQFTETENRATVSIIFERINRYGVRLNTLQLLSAWTWSEEFDLQEKFDALAEEIEPFGFAGEEVDMTLLLRCCAAVIAQDASPEALVNLDGAVVRQRFDEVANGIRGAIDYLKREMHVETVMNLPFTTILVPLAAFFALPDGAQHRMVHEQNKLLREWFWKSCFSRRYSSGVLRNLNTDIAEMVRLRNRQPSKLGNFEVAVGPEFFLENTFRTRSVNTKTFVLLLAQRRPLSFISGSPVSLSQVLKEYNRNEFHHVFPKKYLRDSNQDAYPEDALANFAFLSRSDNNELGGKAPRNYRLKMPDEFLDVIADRALLPKDFFDLDYETFAMVRAESLASEAMRLIGKGLSFAEFNRASEQDSSGC